MCGPKGWDRVGEVFTKPSNGEAKAFVVPGVLLAVHGPKSVFIYIVIQAERQGDPSMGVWILDIQIAFVILVARSCGGGLHGPNIFSRACYSFSFFFDFDNNGATSGV